MAEGEEGGGEEASANGVMENKRGVWHDEEPMPCARVLLKWICKGALRGQLKLLKQNDVCEPIVPLACSQPSQPFIENFLGVRNHLSAPFLIPLNMLYLCRQAIFLYLVIMSLCTWRNYISDQLKLKLSIKLNLNPVIFLLKTDSL